MTGSKPNVGKGAVLIQLMCEIRCFNRCRCNNDLVVKKYNYDVLTGIVVQYTSSSHVNMVQT